ncbi:hypothetical protein WMY93_033648 [Mugilogobius chulae]|uniref:GIY-YIG domain-containing protein n=1 Tax=Mugilogobius chulae TaxID=88201 RepID=A0AAW0MKK6_9GOBI
MEENMPQDLPGNDEEAKIQRSHIQTLIGEAKQTIARVEGQEEEKLSWDNRLRDDIEKLTRSLKQIKRDKFRRDQNDYKEGTVYSWSNQQSRRTRQGRARSVSFNVPSSEDEDHAGDSTTNSVDFLDQRSKTTSLKNREKRGEAGGGRGRFIRNFSPDRRYPTTHEESTQPDTDHHKTVLNISGISLPDTCMSDNIYKQIQGTAMGAAYAPSYAGLFLGLWEQRFIYSEANPFLTKIKWCGRRAPTLKDQLVTSHLPSSRSSTWLQRPIGTFSCGSCNHCSHIDRSTSFKDPSGKVYQLKGYANCNTTFVVYKLECECGCFYIGRTKRRLKDRVSEHKRAIRNQDQQYPMAVHFQTAGHNINTLRVMVIETIPKSWRGGDKLKLLLQRETFWIVTLNATTFPGLNDEIDFVPFL